MHGSATSDSDAQDGKCNIWPGQLNIVSQNFTNNRGQTFNSDTISIFPDFPEMDNRQYNIEVLNSSSTKVQQRGRVNFGAINQSNGENRSYKRQTVINSIIPDVSKFTDRPEVQIPEEVFSEGPSKNTILESESLE